MNFYLKLLAFLVLLIHLGCATNTVDKIQSQDLLKIASVNFKLTGDQDISQQLERIERVAQNAKKQNANYLLLPELLVLDFFPTNPADESIQSELEKASALFSQYEQGLVNIAKIHEINLIGASAITKKDGKFLNRAFFVNSKGKVQYQDKIYPTPWETNQGFVGGKKIEPFEDELFKFVILICHDAEFPIISHQLAPLKPEIIFVPSQTDDLNGMERVRATSAARAIEHMSYVVMTGTSGEKSAPWHSYVGKNFLFGPHNKYFTQPNKIGGDIHREELSIFEVDLKLLKRAREDSKQVYPARDQLKP